MRDWGLWNSTRRFRSRFFRNVSGLTTFAASVASVVTCWFACVPSEDVTSKVDEPLRVGVVATPSRTTKPPKPAAVEPVAPQLPAPEETPSEKTVPKKEESETSIAPVSDPGSSNSPVKVSDPPREPSRVPSINDLTKQSDFWVSRFARPGETVYLAPLFDVRPGITLHANSGQIRGAILLVPVPGGEDMYSFQLPSDIRVATHSFSVNSSDGLLSKQFKLRIVP